MSPGPRPARLTRSGTLTLRARLTALYGAAFAVAGSSLVVMLWFVASTSLENQPDDIVSVALSSDETETLSFLVMPSPGGADEVPWFRARPNLWGSSGHPSPGAEPGVLPVSPEEVPVEPSSRGRAAELTSRVAAANDEARAQTLQTIVLWSASALLATLVLAVGTGWVIASRALAPLHTVTATARRVAGDSLSARIALDGPNDEIKDLADTFDEMLDRLDASFDGQRRFTANASHELRTPLTITRSVLEVTLTDPDCAPETRDLAEKLLAVNRRQGDLIEGLLALASADLTPPEPEPVDLAALAELVADECHAGAEGAQVRIESSTQTVLQAGALPRSSSPTRHCTADPGSSPVPGDRVLLERLVRNLVDNAVRYNVAGGTVRVTVPCPHELVVENTGPVVPEEQVAGLFEPFRRLTPHGTVADRAVRSTRHPGSGLGLSIVRSIVAAHSGSVRAVARDDGGLVVRVLLPDDLEDGPGEQDG